MNRPIPSLRPWLLLSLLVAGPAAQASLTELRDSYADDLQRRTAQAVLDTYNNLIAVAGCRDNNDFPPDDDFNHDHDRDDEHEREFDEEFAKPLAPNADYHQGTGGQCTGQTLALFNNLRRLVHSANDLTGTGRTDFRLNINLTRLGNALRWNAPEEYAAQGSMSNEFAKGQVDSLATRLTALRFGASGFNLGLVPGGSGDAIALAHTSGGGASADGFSRWGGFLNYAYTSGDRGPTSLENAFDFRGHEITLGGDYRLTDQLVLGSLVGIVDQTIDFDGERSVVGGGVESSGFSLMPFALYYRDDFYFSGSLGYQQLAFDSSRTIRYMSQNPGVPGADTVAESSTDARILSQFLEAGYSWRRHQWVVEPFINIEARQIRIDGFVEEDINNDAYDMAIDKQNYDSLEYTLGLTLQYSFSPAFGVLTPYATLEQVGQNKTDSRSLGARYAHAATSENLFELETDKLDSSYNVFTLGIASVMRGARQQTAGAAASGGLQGFIHYQRVENLRHHSIEMISLGLRYEF